MLSLPALRPVRSTVLLPRPGGCRRDTGRQPEPRSCRARLLQCVKQRNLGPGLLIWGSRCRPAAARAGSGALIPGAQPRAGPAAPTGYSGCKPGTRALPAAFTAGDSRTQLGNAL